MSTIKALLRNISFANKIAVGIILSFIIPVVAWFVILAGKGVNVDIASIIELHNKNNILIWIIDTIPVLITIYLVYLKKSQRIEVKDYVDSIDLKDYVISKNVKLAKKIGQGDYSYEVEDCDDDDLLCQSLLVMRNNMIQNSKKESEQNWIAEGKDRISNILRMSNSLENLSYSVLVELIEYIQAIQGAFYILEDDKLVNYATYAYNRKKYLNQEFAIGEGLIGQCAYEMDIIYRSEIPEEYATITSGLLGDKKPSTILIVPLITEDELQGVLEFSSLNDEIPELSIRFMRELGEIIARTIYNLRINQQTEKLLKESQHMTEELRENEEELRQNAEEMRATHEELERSNTSLERQVQEVENAQKRQHSLLENAGEIISIYDKTRQLKYISPSVTQILGYTPEEMTNGKDTERLTRKGDQLISNMFKQLLSDPEQPQTAQYTFMKKDGEKIFLEVTGRNLLDDQAIKGIILNSQDITERKRREKEERMKSKMQALSENSTDMILRLNTSGQFFYANPITEKYLGYKSSDLINQSILTVNLEDNLLDFFKEAIKEIKKDKNKRTEELTIKTPDGDSRIMSIDAIPEINDNELETILFVSHDITEAKKIEKEIKDTNKKMSESINYAQRIQSSILPDNQMIQSVFPNSFIFYKPRDIVSGDFPWFFQKDNKIHIAAVDCTGHGVPGALLSFIGYFILNNITDQNQNQNAAELLDKLHFGVRKTLKQDHIDSDARDGMDIAMVQIIPEENKINYSGAHRPLYLVRDGVLTEYKGDRKAIGGIPHRKKAEKSFKNYEIEYQKGDKIFFFSDGLPDQVGGESMKKYTARRIREVVTENNDYSMSQFSNFFAEDYENWKGNHKQIDDILLIGIEF